MKTSTAIWIVVIVIVVLGGWWWYSNSSNTNTSVTTTTPEQQETANQASTTQNTAPTVTLGTNSTSSLTYLTTDNGMALYTYDKDSVGTSTCYATCAQNWPPYTVASGTQVAAPSGASGQTGTITRADGTMQITYNGMPLYLYIKDTNPGDVTGDGVNKVWHAAKP